MLYNLFENRDFVSVFAVALLAEGVDRNSKVLVNGDVKDIPLDPADYPCTGEIHGIKDTEATSE